MTRMPGALSPPSAARPLPPAGGPRDWPDGALELAEQLHQQLRIGDRQWHALKAQRSRRAAELLAASLVQLLARDQPGGALGGNARRDAIELVEQAARWLRAEVSDPGCPTHGH